MSGPAAPGREPSCPARPGPEASAVRLFRARFGRAPGGIWRAPGRANLMGEHTDYNDGFVLPFALGQGIAAAAGPRTDRKLVLCSAQQPGEMVEVALDGLAPGQVRGWAAYPAGVAWALAGAGYQVPGADLAFGSDLPAGAGLSSSAALECATALALIELAGDAGPGLIGGPAGTGAAGPGPAGPGRGELVWLARRAENEFVGAPTGIMDQSASLLCRAGHVLLLDCRSLASSQVAFDPGAAGVRLLLVNTRSRHELTDGAYGARRAECGEAARRLGVSSLRDLTNLADLGLLTDPVLRRRARHVLADNRRVLDVVRLLRSAGPAAYRDVGHLLTEAHASLRDDFEVSWPEADAVVTAAAAAGALGARMIGGGFGGSVLVLAPAAADGAVRGAVTEAFGRAGWAEPEFVPAEPSDAARRTG